MPRDSRIWRISSGGQITWVTMTDAHMAGAHDVMRRAFIPQETGCIALKIPEDEKAIKDMERICEMVALDEASLVAIDNTCGLVVAVAFNKLHDKEEGHNFFDVLRKEYSSCPATKAKADYLQDVESRVDVFERYGVVCSLDLMYLAVLPEYQGRGLAKDGVRCTEDMARTLIHKASGSRVSLVTATFTSRISQAVGRSLGWEVLVSVPHELFSYEGKKFSERIGPDHPDNAVMAKRITPCSAL